MSSSPVSPVEIHGYVTCPFAWRVRLAAAEKGIAAEFYPADVATPDPRVAQHNPHEHSPLLFHDGLTLRESAVIIEYLDEAFAGPALMPGEARGRAELRLLAADLKGLDVHNERSRPEARKKSEAPLALLEEALAHRTPFLHGPAPGLADLMIWPFLADLSLRKLLIERHSAAQAYLARARPRPAFQTTRPPWAAPL